MLSVSTVSKNHDERIYEAIKSASLVGVSTICQHSFGDNRSMLHFRIILE